VTLYPSEIFISIRFYENVLLNVNHLLLTSHVSNECIMHRHTSLFGIRSEASQNQQ